jgi:thiol-disulfide isomerase/thioredoxin
MANMSFSRPTLRDPLRGLCALFLSVLLSGSPGVIAQTSDTIEFPYDEMADASEEVQAAIEEARSSGRLLLLNFGANWCPDCRIFARAADNPAIKPGIDRDFVVVKIDVGNWDKHPDVVAAWGNPIEGGIPALVVARPDGEILLSTRAGQLSRARHMSDAEMSDFFTRLAGLAEPTANQP